MYQSTKTLWDVIGILEKLACASEKVNEAIKGGDFTHEDVLILVQAGENIERTYCLVKENILPKAFRMMENAGGVGEGKSDV